MSIKERVINKSDDMECYDFFDKQGSLFWLKRDINFNNVDVLYNNLSKQEQDLLDKIIAFFLIGDGEIIENITKNFMESSESHWEKAFYNLQNSIEFVHADVYQRFAESFKGIDKYRQMVNNLTNLNCVVKKFEFMEKYMNNGELYEKHVAYACAEGIFFCTLFVVIFWFKSRNTLDSFIAANERIMKDEYIHFEFQASRWRKYFNRCNNKEQVIKRTLEIIDEAIKVEEYFIEELIPEPIYELNNKKIKNHIKYFANNLLHMLGLDDHLYVVGDLYQYMQNLSLEVKVNFFEGNTVQYSNVPLSNEDEDDAYADF
jgi:ribonucleoside-diphosphate reductase subunit M2